ncbi:MAG: hypothetical protein ACPGVP_04535 [Thiolinea sp.]
MLSITTKGRSKGIFIPLIILCFTLLSGCTVTMMSPYDNKTDLRIETFGKTVNSLMFHLEELDAKQPECRYENHVDTYRDLKVQLQTMDMHEQAKPNNTITQQQIATLQERLNSFITDHKRICQPAVAVSIAQKQINMMLGHILKLERNKRGVRKHKLLIPGKK